MTRSYRHRRMQ